MGIGITKGEDGKEYRWIFNKYVRLHFFLLFDSFSILHGDDRIVISNQYVNGFFPFYYFISRVSLAVLYGSVVKVPKHCIAYAIKIATNFSCQERLFLLQNLSHFRDQTFQK